MTNPAWFTEASIPEIADGESLKALNDNSPQLKLWTTQGNLLTRLGLQNIGLIDGMTLSRQAAKTVTFARGVAKARKRLSGTSLVDVSEPYFMVAATAMNKKLDYPWAAGTNAGGMASGVVLTTTNETIYHCFALGKIDSTATEFGFDSRSDGANLIKTTAVKNAGFSTLRHLGWVHYYGYNSPPRVLGIQPFIQSGDYVFYRIPRLLGPVTFYGSGYHELSVYMTAFAPSYIEFHPIVNINPFGEDFFGDYVYFKMDGGTERSNTSPTDYDSVGNVHQHDGGRRLPSVREVPTKMGTVRFQLYQPNVADGVVRFDPVLLGYRYERGKNW